MWEEEKHWCEKERNIDVGEKHWSLASHTLPAGDLARNPGMYPAWLAIEPETFQFAGWHAIHWATPARAEVSFKN